MKTFRWIAALCGMGALLLAPPPASAGIPPTDAPPAITHNVFSVDIQEEFD